MPCPFLIFSQSDYLIQIVDIYLLNGKQFRSKSVGLPSQNKEFTYLLTYLLTSWLLKKPTDLDLHCLQRQDISWFSNKRVKRINSARFSTFLNQQLLIVHLFFKENICCEYSLKGPRRGPTHLMSIHNICLPGEMKKILLDTLFYLN